LTNQKISIYETNAIFLFFKEKKTYVRAWAWNLYSKRVFSSHHPLRSHHPTFFSYSVSRLKSVSSDNWSKIYFYRMIFTYVCEESICICFLGRLHVLFFHSSRETHCERWEKLAENSENILNISVIIIMLNETLTMSKKKEMRQSVNLLPLFMTFKVISSLLSFAKKLLLTQKFAESIFVIKNKNFEMKS
jgi:hypothetical protein